jgi:hypothetical protein
MVTARRFALVALVSAVLAALLTTGIWAATRTSAWTSGTMMGNGYGSAMMGGYGLAGDGRRVDSLEGARQRAQAFADTLGLRAGEVMQFSNGYYAELNTVDGHGATEVLIEPRDGSVQVEFGPAMMWNTSYGMHRGGAVGSARVSGAEAQSLAQRWLDAQRPGLTAAEPEEFPGYFTLHVLQDGKIAGMMSVNSATGAVWYHNWHGQYLGMSED